VSTRIGFKRFALLAAALLVLALVVDLRRAPAAQLSARAAIGAIHVYQATLSPLYAWAGVKCRFTPTCSHYGEEAVRRFGAFRGGWLATKRLLKCGPWTPMGTADPVPLSL
jgi:putative membrane protein insertion efficiency factor